MKIAKNRILGLDILRVIAIYFVLIAHAGLNPFPKILLGGIGVELFFVLSGFLIGGIILRNFENYEGLSTISKFWINRWFRTLPLYYLALFIQIVLSKKIDWGYLYYFVFLQNNFYGIKLFVVSWSLVVEEWFYLMLPGFFIIIKYFFKKIDILGIIVIIALLLMFKFFYVYYRLTPFSGVNGNIILRADSMMIGVLLAYIKRYISNFYNIMANGFVLIFSILAIIFIQYYLFIYTGMKEINSSFFIKSIYFPLQSIFIALLIPFLDSSDLINVSLSKFKYLRNFIVWSSILSYSFYLFHMNIYQLVEFFYKGFGLFPIKLISLYIVSYYVYKFYEKPVTDLREKFN
jgi:peptidoglycan/LPS O-acetylase OafA/YrhL